MRAKPISETVTTPTVIVASYRRSGTHLTIDSLLNNGKNIHKSYVNFDRLGHRHPEPLSARAFSNLISEAGDRTVVLKTHAPHRSDIDTPEEAALWERLLADSHTVYVLRDPRDVMVSLWHYRLSFDPGYAEKATFSDHIKRNIERWRLHVEHWMEREVSLVRFEDWARDYELTLDKTLSSLHVARRQDAINVYGTTSTPRQSLANGSTLQGRLIRLLDQLPRQFTQRFQRQPQLTGISRRSGRVGDWREMFGDDDRALVHDVAGDLLTKLGYETT